MLPGGLKQGEALASERSRDYQGPSRTRQAVQKRLAASQGHFHYVLALSVEDVESVKDYRVRPGRLPTLTLVAIG